MNNRCSSYEIFSSDPPPPLPPVFLWHSHGTPLSAPLHAARPRTLSIYGVLFSPQGQLCVTRPSLYLSTDEYGEFTSSVAGPSAL